MDQRHHMLKAQLTVLFLLCINWGNCDWFPGLIQSLEYG